MKKSKCEGVEVSKCGKIKMSKLPTQKRSPQRRVSCTVASSSHATQELVGTLLVKGAKTAFT